MSENTFVLGFTNCISVQIWHLWYYSFIQMSQRIALFLLVRFYNISSISVHRLYNFPLYLCQHCLIHLQCNGCVSC